LSSLPSFEQSIDSLDQLSPYNDSWRICRTSC